MPKRHWSNNGTSRRQYRLDPRTTLLLLIAGNVVMFTAGLSGRALIARLTFMTLPVIMASLAGRWRMAVVYIAVTAALFGVETACMNDTLGAATLIIGAVTGLLARVLPAAMMGYVAITTIAVADLMAALERWHMPRAVVIPLAVVLRFLPTAFEEDRAIAQAMQVRGLTPHRVGASAWFEYRTVPLIVATVNAGEELAQAALTRALGAPGRPVRLAKVGFHVYDALMLAIAAAGIAVWIWG
ncbi:MAG: energy-coupling factor transporter transmembrane protein EcfT [Propionibacteriaceae bacterium]|nr:energy-coupling factor transporter transmembrane protein EcfT [Propionibacteriaceae bacterium]